jgi:iron(III) transport system permease protein
VSSVTLEESRRPGQPPAAPRLSAEALVRLAVVLAVAGLVSAPLLMLLFAAVRGPRDLLPFEPGARFTLDNLATAFSDPILYQKIIPDTLIFAAGAVALNFALSFALAWLVERTDLPARNAVYVLLLAPTLMPGVMIGIAWVYLLGPNAGWLNVWLRALLGGESGPFNVFSMAGLIFVQGMAAVPFTFVLLAAALRNMDAALEEAGAMSGASPLQTLWRITLPILRPGLLAPLILSAIITIEQFEMPLIFGLPAQVNVFSTRIFWELNPPSGLPAYGRAAATALPFLVISFALLYAYKRLTEHAARFATITGKGYRPRRIPLGRWRWPSLALVGGYLLLGVVLPVFVLLWTSLFGFAPPSLARLSQLSLASYANVLADAAVPLAFRNTLLVAAGSAAVVSLLGALVSWIVVRTRARARHLLDFMSFTSVAIPAVIAGFATMLLYLTVPLPVYGTVWILVLAYSYRLALPTRITQAGLLQIHQDLEDAAAVAGGTWWATFRQIVFPLLLPAIVASWLVLFVVGFREFTLPMVLHSPENIVASVVLYRFFDMGKTAEAAALSVLMMLVVLLVIVVGRTLVLRRVERG